jgi:proteasome lid subunit RPN8/RPN11
MRALIYGQGMFRIHASRVDEMIAHAKQDHPIEACGVVAGPEGSDDPQRVIRMTNAEPSTSFFRFDPAEQLRLLRELDSQDQEIVVVYHSHTQSQAYPSPTDVGHATEPQAHYVLVSTVESGQGEGPVSVRSYRIVDGQITEESLDVVPD